MHVIILNPDNSKCLEHAGMLAAIEMSMVLDGKRIEIEPKTNPIRAKIYGGKLEDIDELGRKGWNVVEEIQIPS